MHSLVHYGFVSPAVPNTAGTGQWTEGNPFTGVQSAYYWTNTSYTGDPSNAWRVSLNVGIVDGTNKTTTLYVWPVRGGQ